MTVSAKKGLVHFRVTLSIVVVVVVIVIVIETANWLYTVIACDNDNRFADNDNEGGRQPGTRASMVLNQATKKGPRRTWGP